MKQVRLFRIHPRFSLPHPAAFALLLLASIIPLRAADRVALVIGNSHYDNLPEGIQLASPAADAADVAAQLKALGYTIVTGGAIVNARRQEMIRATEAFASKAAGADAAVFYYSGHGIQIGDENFLMARDTPAVTSYSSLRNNNVNLRESVMSALEEAGVQTKVIILDCCRNNPLATQLDHALDQLGKSLKTKSLGEISGYGSGFYLAFATSPGKEALDGNGARNSPFTAAMLKTIPGSASKDIDFFFRDVKKLLGKDQISWTNHSLNGDFSLASLTKPGRAAIPRPQPPSVPQPEPAAQKILLSEDFESIPIGEIPKGFVKTGALGVAEDAAHSGKRSLRIEPAVKGARVITLTGAKLAAIGGTHWGRLYYKVKLPTPLPVLPEGKTSTGIHTTLVSGRATSPLANDPIDVRLMGTSTNMTGAFKYLFNVQPMLRKEFGVVAKTPFQYSDEWTLAEWYADHDTQTYQFFINGQEITDIALHKGAGQFEGAEIPAAFESLSFGWSNYQPANGEGFTVWIDDLALGKKRIGPTPSAASATLKK